MIEKILGGGNIKLYAPGTFEKVIGNLRKIKNKDYNYYKKHIGFSIVLAPPYDLESLIEFFGREEFSTERPPFVSFVDPYDTVFFENFPNLKEINKKLNNKLDELGRKYAIFLISKKGNFNIGFLRTLFEDKIRDIHRRNLIKLHEKIYPNGICLPGFQRLFVSPTGKFYACEKIGYSFPIGDIYKGFDIDAVYNLLEKYINVSEEMCLSCWAVRLCKSCFTRAKKGEELNEKRKEENCFLIKKSLDRALKLYCEIIENNSKSLDYLKNYKQIGGLEIAFQFLENYYNKRGVKNERTN